MKTDLMKAVRFHGPKDLRFESVPRPAQPEGTQVKVKVAAAGICGSDLHVYETGVYVTQIPVVMGHEFAGTVLDTGSEVQTLAPGDHVVGDSRVACGQCDFCAEGYPNLCRQIGFLGEVRDGAYAEEIVVDESSLVRIASAVPFDMAALAEPLSVAIHAFRQANITGSPRTLIIGGGPVGALIQTVLETEGIRDVWITERSAYRRKIIERAYPQSVLEPENRYDLVFETSGSRTAVQDVLLHVMRKQGTLVMVGLFGGPVPFDLNQLVENEWKIYGCAAFSDELPAAARMLETHWLKFSHLVSHGQPLANFREAFDLLLASDKNAMKIVFLPELEA